VAARGFGQVTCWGPSEKAIALSFLAALASLDELEGVLSWCGVECDTGKEGDRVQGSLGKRHVEDQTRRQKPLIWPCWCR